MLDEQKRKKIKDFCVEMSASMLRAEAERDFRKDAVTKLHEELELPKKHLNQIAKTYHKQNFEEQSETQSEFETLYEETFGLAEEEQEED